jgi:hypothetical protein
VQILKKIQVVELIPMKFQRIKEGLRNYMIHRVSKYLIMVEMCNKVKTLMKSDHKLNNE